MHIHPSDPADFSLDSYDYELLPELISKQPQNPRHNSKLLVYHYPSKSIIHSKVWELDQFLAEKDHLVLNESKVVPSRLLGQRPTGGACEVLFLDYVPIEEFYYRVLLKSRHRKKQGDIFLFGDLTLEIVDGKDTIIEGEGIFLVRSSMPKVELQAYLNKVGLVPLPPYLKEASAENYQTTFAKHEGSAAAPTAGLHFTDELFQKLKNKNFLTTKVTLHVGAGTFKPIETPDIRHHVMHQEKYFIDSLSRKALLENRDHLVAVGTTSLRVLESAWGSIINPEEVLEKIEGETSIFLYPGKRIESIKGLMTNFHLPRTSLLALVSALVGRKELLRIYQIAKDQKYGFYSYGDAMLILLR